MRERYPDPPRSRLLNPYELASWRPEDMGASDGIGAPDVDEEFARLLRDRRSGDREVLDTDDPFLEGLV
jgi:hypothetical protein